MADKQFSIKPRLLKTMQTTMFADIQLSQLYRVRP
jgi:hypothetical protein